MFLSRFCCFRRSSSLIRITFLPFSSRQSLMLFAVCDFLLHGIPVIKTNGILKNSPSLIRQNRRINMFQYDQVWFKVTTVQKGFLWNFLALFLVLHSKSHCHTRACVCKQNKNSPKFKIRSQKEKLKN